METKSVRTAFKKKMKNLFISRLQKTLGFEKYLSLFSLYKIAVLKIDKGENNFLHFLNLIPDNGIVLDIGANIGLMTVHLARRLKNSTIMAFEPIPYNLLTLKKNIRLFRLPNVEVMGFALGDKTGRTKMLLPYRDSILKQGLCHIIKNDQTIFQEGTLFETEVQTLDSIKRLQNSEKPVNAIKMDVEGYECFVVKGGINLISKHKPILYCELAEEKNKTSTFHQLKEVGYQVLVIESGKLVNYIPERHQTQDFFFVHEDKIQALRLTG